MCKVYSKNKWTFGIYIQNRKKFQIKSNTELELISTYLRDKQAFLNIEEMILYKCIGGLELYAEKLIMEKACFEAEDIDVFFTANAKI